MSKLDDAITIIVDGSTVTSGAASARIAIPVNAAGITANVIRVICPVEAAYAYIRVGNSTVVATTNSLCVNAEQELILDVCGCTHIAHIQGSAAAIVNVSPVEW